MSCGKLTQYLVTLEGKNESLDLPSEFAQLSWQIFNLVVNLPDKRKHAVVSEIFTQLGQRLGIRRASNFLPDKLN